MAERKYTLTKLAAGDYVMPSNDGRTLWRLVFAREENGGSWLIMHWLGRGSLEAIPREELLDEMLWETWDSEYETRREAIDKALQAAP